MNFQKFDAQRGKEKAAMGAKKKPAKSTSDTIMFLRNMSIVRWSTFYPYIHLYVCVSV